MADSKISALTELAVAPDVLDEFVVVDKSDTTMAATGTDKRIKAGTLVPVDPAAGTPGLRTLGTATTSAAPGDKLAALLGTYRGLGEDIRAAAVWVSTTTANTYILHTQAATAITAANSAFGAFYLDPADYAISGYTTKLRLRSWVLTDSVAPAVNLTVGLYPVTAFGGGSNVLPLISTIGAAIASSTYTTPGASTQTKTDAADVTFPTAGWYCFAYAPSGTTATNSNGTIGARLMVRWV